MAITYDAGNNIITVTGYTEGTPCNFTDIYNEDVANGWGVVTKQCDNQFCFDAGLEIGDGSTTTWFADTNKLVVFNECNVEIAYIHAAIAIRANATAIFGEISNSTYKTGKNGCNIWISPSVAKYSIMVEGSGNLYFYGSTLDGNAYYGFGGAENPNTHTGTLRVWSSILNKSYYSTSALSGMANTIINIRKQSNLYGANVAKGTFENIQVYSTLTYGGIAITSAASVTVKNLILKDCTYAISLYSGAGITHHFINIDVSSWTFDRWASSTAIASREYEFDLKVIDKDNTPIDGATVKIWDKNSNLVVDTTTNASGVITTQTISRGYYDSDNGDTLQEYSPHLIKIEKAGYTAYEGDFTLEEKVDWTIALQGVLKRNPAMTGGMV